MSEVVFEELLLSDASAVGRRELRVTQGVSATASLTVQLIVACTELT